MRINTEIDGQQLRTELPAVWAIPASLQQLLEYGEADLVEELIADFQTDTARRLTLIGTAIAAANHSAVRLEAHTVKGSALQVGANRLAAVCYQMELSAKSGEPGDLGRIFDSLLSSFEEVRRTLAARRAPAPPGGTSFNGPAYGE